MVVTDVETPLALPTGAKAKAKASPKAKAAEKGDRRRQRDELCLAVSQ